MKNMRDKMLFAALLALLLCCLCAVALGEEACEHQWELKTSSGFHWQECALCGEILHIEEHTFGDGADCEYDQLYHWRTCAVCGWKLQEYHEADCENKGQCTVCGATAAEGALMYTILHEYEEGVYERDENSHWFVCVKCGEKLDKGNHSASCGEPDRCSECGMTKAEGAVISDTGHEFDDDAFEHDEKKHWCVCKNCGEKVMEMEHYSECGSPEKCLICGATTAEGAVMNEIIHDYDLERWEYDETKHWNVCRVCGEKSENVHHTDCLHVDKCEECGATVAEGAVMDYVVHYYKTSQYGHNESEHWHVCLLCGEKLYEVHHFTYCDSSDKAVCSECGATQAEGAVIADVNHTIDMDAVLFDETNHWFVCRSCGEKVYVYPHDFEDGVCVYCGYKQETPQPADKSARYTVEDFNYDGEYLTGKLKHVEGTEEADRLFLRVTLFLGDGSTSISVNYVDEDTLTFEAGASGNIVHISVAVTGTARSVRADGSWTAMGSYEY